MLRCSSDFYHKQMLLHVTRIQDFAVWSVGIWFAMAEYAAQERLSFQVEMQWS